MEIVTSKLSSKGQTVIPATIRHRLSLHAGDSVVFEEWQGQVVLRKAQPLDRAYLQSLDATLAEEWTSSEDAAAYDDL